MIRRFHVSNDETDPRIFVYKYYLVNPYVCINLHSSICITCKLLKLFLPKIYHIKSLLMLDKILRCINGGNPTLSKVYCIVYCQLENFHEPKCGTWLYY